MRSTWGLLLGEISDFWRPQTIPTFGSVNRRSATALLAMLQRVAGIVRLQDGAVMCIHTIGRSSGAGRVPGG